MLSQRLEPKLWQRQVLTPGLVQMMSVLQMPRLELKEAIAQEIEKNPMLEESLDGGEEVTPEEMHNLLEAERVAEPADASILEATNGSAIEREADAYASESTGAGGGESRNRSVRRDRFRRVFQRLPRSRTPDSRRRIGR